MVNSKEVVERDLQRIEIMIERFERIGEDREKLLALGVSADDEMLWDNISFQMLQAGEQVNKISDGVKEKFPDLDWKRIKYNCFRSKCYSLRHKIFTYSIRNSRH